MVKEGIIDPTKVVRSALQNAASVATLLLTSDALVADAAQGGEEAGRRRRHGRHVLKRVSRQGEQERKRRIQNLFLRSCAFARDYC